VVFFNLEKNEIIRTQRLTQIIHLSFIFEYIFLSPGKGILFFAHIFVDDVLISSYVHDRFVLLTFHSIGSIVHKIHPCRQLRVYVTYYNAIQSTN
jgi:hypothetical protein